MNENYEIESAFIIVSEACNKIGLVKPSIQYNGDMFYAIGWFKDSVFNLAGGGKTPELAAIDLERRYKEEKQERVESLKKQLEELENE